MGSPAFVPNHLTWETTATGVISIYLYLPLANLTLNYLFEISKKNKTYFKSVDFMQYWIPEFPQGDE